MKKDVLLILIDKRSDSAIEVQKILTAWGCFIKARLGLHENILDECSQTGLIFIELVGSEEKHEELTRKLNLLTGVSAKLVNMSV
ncbi:MAG: hypothetical protein OCD01_16475 [Fibrobacterales bacterium]